MNAAHEQKAKPAFLTKWSKLRVTLFGLIKMNQTNVATETKKQVTNRSLKLPLAF
jgi:hypothetical protein